MTTHPMSVAQRIMGRKLTAFRGNERGNVAVIFALSLLPTLGFVGVAVDYTQATGFKEYARAQSDVAALTVASNETSDVSPQAIAAAKAKIEDKYGERITGLAIDGKWIDSGNYRVTISADVHNAILSAVPGMLPKTPVAVETIVNRIPQQFATLPPTLSQLSPEAADYNRLYMYCYDPKRKNDPDKGRREMTAIADNGDPGLDYSKNALPQCKAGELISYKLRNVRNARSDKKKWEGKDQTVYEYYTDTTMDPGSRVQTNNMVGEAVHKNGSTTPIDMVSNPILETILCDTERQCRPRSEGGILPNNHETGRTPKTASGSCSEGKFLYFGWEDRPPTGSSDRDYDDIRLIVSCPKLIKTADKKVRIVK